MERRVDAEVKLRLVSILTGKHRESNQSRRVQHKGVLMYHRREILQYFQFVTPNPLKP